MAQRRGPRRDFSSQRLMPQGRRGLLDPWEGASGNQQSSALGSQTSLLAQLGVQNAQTTLTDSLLNTITLLGRSELSQLQSILALSAAQRVGQQLTSDLHSSYGSLNRGRLYSEGLRNQRPAFSKRVVDKKKVIQTSRSQSSKEDGKDRGAGSRDENHTDDSKRNLESKSKKRKHDEVDDSDDEEVTAYAGIPTDSFYCHVCGKRMWDDKSFSNHVKGRAHLSLMDLREQFYKIQVDLMRNERKLAESLRSIEMDRIRRRGKNVPPLAQEFCTMCDLHFFGNIVAHRKQSSHQALKKFLHPCCSPCEKEFHTRIEWDVHKLSPEHMKKCPDGGDIKSDPSIEMDDFDIDEKAKAEVLDAETPFPGGISGMIRRLVPKYNPDASFGPKMVVAKEGFQCHRCMFFFDDEEAANLHCKSKTHYDKCVAYEKRKAKRAMRFSKSPRKRQREDENGEATVPDTSDAEENSADKTIAPVNLASEAEEKTGDETLETTTGDTINLTDHSLVVDDLDNSNSGNKGENK